MKKLLFTFLLLSFACKLFAQDGILDSTFNGDGIVTTHFDNVAEGRSVAIQSDGKIVVVGTEYLSASYQFAMVRYNIDGSLDSSFGSDGKVIPIFPEPSDAESVTIQADGKILVGGGAYLEYYLSRYNTNGTLDSSFGVNGLVQTQSYDLEADFTSIALQPDGKIVATGYTGHSFLHSDHWITLCRYDSDGTLGYPYEFSVDTVGFNDPLNDRGMSLAIQGDLKIIVGGVANGKMVLIRFNNDFSSDNSFGADGVVKIAVGNGSFGVRSIAIQADQKILAAGGSTEGLTIVRFNVDGVLDNTFGDAGEAVLPNYSDATSIAILENGKIQAAFNSYNDFALARFNSDGSLDSTFGNDGIVTTDIDSSNDYASSMAIQSGGNIIVGGSSNGDFAVARYLSSLNVGILDLSAPNNSVLIYPNPIEQNATLKYSFKNEEEISIQLLDVEGRILKTFVSNEKQKAGEHEQQIILPEGLANCSYLIVISSANGGKLTVKVVK